MLLTELVIAACAFVVTALITRLQRTYALRSGMLDTPSARSSHAMPTPRGGGLAIVVAALLSSVVLYRIGATDSTLLSVLWSSGLAVAIVGYVDDRYSLKPFPRFAVHVLAAGWAVFVLGGLSLGQAVLPMLSGWLAVCILIAGTCWAINSFNFMDGIDGIAGAELVFVCMSAALLALVLGRSGSSAYLLCIAAAGLGFLCWNWAPARIFMGDVGSGFLGLLIAILAMHSHRRGVLSIWTWLTLTAVFLADTTVTLLRRLLQRKRWYEAHRTHAYQHLARYRGSHAQVVWIVIAMNVLVLLPAAFVSEARPRYAPAVALGSIVALAALCIALGAGKAEKESISADAQRMT